MIDGISITSLKQMSNDLGKVMHMLRNDSKNFTKFGEVYFSTIYQNKTKGWHRHKKMTSNFAIVSGEVKFVLYDSRLESKTKGKIEEFFLSQENYKLITVPPLIWSAIQCVGAETAIVAIFTDLPYDDKEIERKSIADNFIKYDWSYKK